MIKSFVRSQDLEPARFSTPAVGPWLRLARTMSAAAQSLLSWPATAYRERQDMEQLGRMSERDLRDIGLIRQDLYDMQALPLGRGPTSVLGRRVHERKRVRPRNPAGRPDAAAWRV